MNFGRFSTDDFQSEWTTILNEEKSATVQTIEQYYILVNRYCSEFQGFTEKSYAKPKYRMTEKVKHDTMKQMKTMDVIGSDYGEVVI